MMYDSTRDPGFWRELDGTKPGAIALVVVPAIGRAASRR
jgi:hypothetical protein